MKKKIIYLSLILACITACSSNDSKPDDSGTNPDPTDPENPTEPVVTAYDGYDLLWNDEFNATKLDAAKWSYETGTGINGDFGTGQLDRATDRPANVSMVTGSQQAPDGALAITTTKEAYMDRDYTSGRINTKGKFSCGPGSRIEARIWTKGVRYKGQGFAFWMMPAEIPSGQTHLMWPQGGEIDITEFVGAIPYANLGSVHYAWSWENNEFQDWNHAHKGAYYSFPEKQVPAVNPGFGGWPVADNAPDAGSSAYHLYRIDWFTDRIEFSIDEHIYHINYLNDGGVLGNAPDGEDADATVPVNGKNIFKSEYSHHFNEWKPFAHKFYLIFSAGVGGNDNLSYGGAIVPEAKFPCTTLIDYVRVYKRK